MFGVFSALARALSLAGVPSVVIRDLDTSVRLRTPPLPPPPTAVSSESDDTPARHQPHSTIPSLVDLLKEEAHEVSIRRCQVRRKRATDSASKVRRSRRLAAKEDPCYTDATTKATRVKAAQLDLTRASARMKSAVEESGVLLRPPPSRISKSKLLCLGRACGLSHLSEVEDEVATTA